VSNHPFSGGIRMSKYKNVKDELPVVERYVIPFVVFKKIDNQIVPLVISAGFCDLYGIGKKEAYELMSRNMYRDVIRMIRTGSLQRSTVLQRKMWALKSYTGSKLQRGKTTW
jgi:hypothetical protein